MEFSYYPTVTNNDLRLPLCICSVGITEKQCKIVRPAGRQDTQLLYTACGSGEAVIGGKKFFLPKGSVMYLRAFEEHAYYPVTEPWTSCWITYGGHMSESAFEIEGHVINITPELDFVVLLQEIYAYRETDKWRTESNVLLYRLLFEINNFFNRQKLPADDARGKLETVFSYISNHYAEDIELGEMAALAGVSKEYLCLLFKRHTGMRPFEYITKYRIKTAKSIMQNNKELKICAVGEKVGFHDSSYFSKVFKKYESVTPAQYSGKI